MLQTSSGWCWGVRTSWLGIVFLVSACAPLPPVKPLPPLRSKLPAPSTDHAELAARQRGDSRATPTPTLTGPGLRELELGEIPEPFESPTPPPDLVDKESDTSLAP